MIRFRYLFTVLLVFNSCYSEPKLVGVTRIAEAKNEPPPPLRKLTISQDSLPEAVTEVFNGSTDAIVTPTDVIFAVDTSGSMSDETERLQNTLPQFLNAMSQAFPEDTFQMFMLASRDDININYTGDRFHLIDTKVGSNDALEQIYEFVENPANQCSALNEKGCVRKDTKKEFVIVSDDDSDYSVFEAKSIFIGDFYPLGWGVNGFVGTSELQEKDWCTIASVGSNYLSIASETNGLVQHLCDENYANLLSNLSSFLIQNNAKTKFELSYLIGDHCSYQLSVNDVILDETQYSISDRLITLNEGIGENGVLEVYYCPIF